MNRLKLFGIVLAFVLNACATSSPKSSGKPYEFCSCGPTIDGDGKPYCAIFSEQKNPGQLMKALASDPRPTCEPGDCSQLFSRFCQKIQMSGAPKPTPHAPVASCYCDSILLENDKGQVTLHCAAWAEGEKNLIEYHALEECAPTRCSEAPFNLAPKVCNNSFKAFYPPLLNKR